MNLNDSYQWNVNLDVCDFGRALRALIWRERSGRIEVALPSAGPYMGVNTELVAEGVNVEDHYCWYFPREIAAPLYGALGGLLGAVDAPLLMRKDFEHERARRERLEDAITHIATSLSLTP